MPLHDNGINQLRNYMLLSFLFIISLSFAASSIIQAEEFDDEASFLTEEGVKSHFSALSKRTFNSLPLHQAPVQVRDRLN